MSLPTPLFEKGTPSQSQISVSRQPGKRRQSASTNNSDDEVDGTHSRYKRPRIQSPSATQAEAPILHRESEKQGKAGPFEAVDAEGKEKDIVDVLLDHWIVPGVPARPTHFYY
jgi:hypothetical protein